ncbi:MAG: hypothetical protein M1546_05690 [Chloroflexi bacterium]|nr:hypothetical protein [Chloroflexota bacterium]
MDADQVQKDDQAQVVNETVVPAKRTRRGVLLAAGGVGLAVVLGGAAYVAGNLLNAPKEGTGGGTEIMVSSGSDGGKTTTKQLNRPKIKNAPEVPASEPEATGLYLRRQDNSVFIGTGDVQMMVQRDSNGKTQASAKHNGPEVEVVINRDTAIYRDTTPITMEDMEQGRELQQVVESVASLDDLVANLNDTDSLQVWGTRNGDRIVAKTVVYRPPFLINGMGGG